jgi:hypothetical protein
MKRKTFAYPGTIDLDLLSKEYLPGSTQIELERNRDVFAFIIGSVDRKSVV